MSRPPLWPLALALPLLAAAPPLRDTPPGAWLESADARLEALAYRLRGARPAPADPVILAIDEESLELGSVLDPAERRTSPLWRRMGPWPWPRALQAELAAIVLEKGAARVVFNVVQAGPSRFGAADDAAFVGRLAPWRDRLVLAAALSLGERQGLEPVRLLRPVGWQAWGERRPVLGLTSLLQSPDGLTTAIPGERWVRRNLDGFARPWPVPLAYAATGRSVPAEPLGIDPAGPAGTLRRVPAWRVREVPAGFWRGRTVLIGATASRLGDQQETAFGPQSGTELQGAALATVLEDRGRRAPPDAALLGLLVGAGGLVLLTLRRPRSSGRTLAVAWVLAGGLLVVIALAWWPGRWRLPASALLLAPLLGGGGRAWVQGVREQRERAYLHQLLARRISPTLLADILQDPGPFWTTLGGSRARCVVLFTDLVGFTPLSARLEPGPLFALLNRYFETIAAAVIEEQGLVDKFIGDALMAEFGVPRSRGERAEALAAVRAALAMRRRLQDLNAVLVGEGLPPLRQGIGLHVGEVYAGNLGSSQRLEYTVVGAAVNVASRLEGLTRRFPDQPILISGELRALLPRDWPVVPLGKHGLKGWPEPIEVYGLGEEPAGPAAPPSLS